MNTLQARLGQVIRQLRRTRELTQEELAERAGIHVTFLSRIESGRALPGLDVLERLARALGVTLAEVVQALDAEPDSGRAGQLLEEIQNLLAGCSLAELRLIRDFVGLLRRGHYGLRTPADRTEP